MKNANTWKRWLTTLAISCVVLFGNVQVAQAAIKVVGGGLTTVQVECSTLCTQGELTGGLAGQLDFEMASMTATSHPDVFTYVGTNVITTPHGTLTGTDYGIWNIATGEFTDFTTFTSGTGIYEGVIGTLVIYGIFDPVAGMGASNYFATLHL